ncbi:hypothetical protein P5P81_03260 [Tritonibacter mobilis]|nr:hypothetical protein [Tritonibacter mobilis]
MSLISRLMMQAAAGTGGPRIEDVFKATAYTGDGATSRDFTGGPNMLGLGGLAVHKSLSMSQIWLWEDTLRGAGNYLTSTSTSSEGTAADTVKSFDLGGVTIGSNLWLNSASHTYIQYLFARSQGFFDVVEFTGDGTADRAIPHNLGVAPGMIIVKWKGGSSDWWVYHKDSLDAFSNPPEAHYLRLQGTFAGTTVANIWGTAPTDSVFYVDDNTGGPNATGRACVAYLFAHDPSAEGLIQCGGYTGNGNASGPSVSLGWEPQFVMIKRTKDGSSNEWRVYDNLRPSGGAATGRVSFESSGGEVTDNPLISFTPTGFTLDSAVASVNASGGNYIYMAIRAEGV